MPFSPSTIRLSPCSVRVTRPLRLPIAGTPIAAKGKVLLDVDGVHHLVLRNVGGGIGSWTAKTTTTPPSLVKRRGYVRPAATALLPVVTKVSPSSDYHKDQTAAVTLTGRDLQPGADVRLVRRGFADILATDIIVDSETSLRCSLDLATAPETGVDSIGVWKLGMWNAPVYTTPGDRTTLVKDSATDDQKKTFECRSASSITLPPGVRADTEVWHIKFNSDFQGDLNRMGLGSDDSVIEGLMRDAVEAYTVCFLRTLMRANETTGKLSKNTSPSISFIVGSVPSAAGTPGEDYNRIEVGGEWQQGDEHDPTEPLDWGSSPIDAGNAHPDDLSVEVSDGNGGTKRAGRGARTRILDPGAVTANADWVSAMAPLRGAPLTGNDRPMFANSFRPATTSRANRYRTMVLQMTRASREIAALIAHHIGRAMGLPAGGGGPMANPTTAGAFWITTPSLTFTHDDLATLRGAAKVNVLPGTSASLTVGYFPLIAMPTAFLPNCKTQVPYTVDWNYSGGRANAVEGDYGVKYSGGNPPLDLTVSVRGITGTARLYLDASQALFYCNIHYFRVTATDTVRDTATSFIYRLNVLPNLALLRAGQEYNNAVNCQNAILATL